MQREYTTVMVTAPAFFGGEMRRWKLGDSIYRMHHNNNANGEVFWITRTLHGVTRASQVWTTRQTMRSKWNEIMMGQAV